MLCHQRAARPDVESCKKKKKWSRRAFPLLGIIVMWPHLIGAPLTHDVKAYGAKGDGSTNDTRAVQAAIDAARTLGVGIVYFPTSSACYMVTGLTFYSDLIYTGENQDVCVKAIISGARLVATPALSAFSNATIANLTFDGNSTGFTGGDCLELRGPTNVVIDHVTTTRCGEDGVYVTGWGAGTSPAGQGDGLFITRLKSSYNARNGISIIVGKNITIRDSVFEHHTVSAPFAGADVEPNSAVQSVESITFENCRFLDNGYNGFTAWEAYADRPLLDLRLINCTFEGNGRNGAYIASSHYVLTGIYVSGSISANQSRADYPGGLDIRYANNVVVTNLSVADASQALNLVGVNGARVANSTLSGSVRDLNLNRSTNVIVHTSTSLVHGTQSGPFTADAGIAPRITTTSLRSARVGSAYRQTFAVTGDPPMAWVQTGGNLPADLTLSSGGIIAGTPATAGIYTFTVKASNTITYDERTYTLIVSDPNSPSRPSLLHKKSGRPRAARGYSQRGKIGLGARLSTSP